MAYREQLNVGMLWLVGFATIILTAVSILLLQAYYYWVQQSEWQDKVASATYDEITNLNAMHAEELASYGVADAETERIHIPISTALQQVAEKY